LDGRNIKGKSSLKWCQMVKEEARLEEYTKSLVGKEGIRLQFRPIKGSAGLFKDKKQCVGCVIMKGMCCVTVVK